MNPFAIQQRSLRSAFVALIVYIFLISSVCCKNLKSINYNPLKNIKSVLAAAVILTHCNPSNAADGKQFNLPSSEVEKIVADDIKFRQALITADFTRSLYSESCRFQDEIDVYPIDDYVRGTKLLFNPALSHVDLIGPVTTVSDSSVSGASIVTFKFSEVLAFNIPILKDIFNLYPKVSLSGNVELHRDASTGLIDYSREKWDQPVADVIKSAKF